MVDKTGAFPCLTGGKQATLFKFSQVDLSCLTMGDLLFNQQVDFQIG
jgi:hypothetical protein